MMHRIAGRWRCEEHPDFVSPDEAHAAGHLRLYHPDLWNPLEGVEVVVNPNREQRRAFGLRKGNQ